MRAVMMTLHVMARFSNPLASMEISYQGSSGNRRQSSTMPDNEKHAGARKARISARMK
jgi:hypothetical protein